MVTVMAMVMATDERTTNTKEPLNKSTAAAGGSFAPTYQFEK